MLNDEDDDEPLFHMHFVKDCPVKYHRGHWETYDRSKKAWHRLCHECTEVVWKPNGCLCHLHYDKENETRKRTKTIKKKSKRLNTKLKPRKKRPLAIANDSKIEAVVSDESEEFNDSLAIVISVSASLNKRQLSQVKEFITKFHTESQSVQFTCESQPDYIDDTTTHVITNDVGSFTTILSKQIIQACVRHIFVGSINWITSSFAQSSIADHFPFEILRDKISSQDSRGIKQCRFDQLPVFPSSCVIAVECHNGIKQMKMTREELIDIVELSGATLFNDYVPYKTLIILCNSKQEKITKQKENPNNENTTHYCKPQFLFDSIVRHEVQPIANYLL